VAVLNMTPTVRTVVSGAARLGLARAYAM